jgi:hypothetical protein
MSDWIKTTQMADALGCHRKTLIRLKNNGYFAQGRHFRKTNPLAPRGEFVWHRTRVLLKMDAD